MEPLSSNPIFNQIISNISFVLEIIAVIIIFLSIMLALINFLRHFFQHEATQECIHAFKQSVGRGIQVALELLIAADLINTVVLSATLENVAVLAILVLIRTFLSWTLVMETNDNWPFPPKPQGSDPHP